MFGSNTMDIVQREYFYDLSDEQFIENKFADFEGIFSQVYDKLVDNADITTLTPEERHIISFFLSHQHIRTRKFREVVKQASEHTLETVDEDDIEYGEARKAVETGATEEGAKQWQAQLTANALEGFADLLCQMNWFLFVNKTEYPLWTSDNPITIFNPINPEPDPERGIKQPGSKVHVPLSTDLVLALYDPGQYFVKSKREKLTEKEYVDSQNKLQVEHSHRQVFSLIEDFQFAREVIEENPEHAELDYSDSLVG